jgi:phage regulator Rha-like protein
MTEKNTSIVPEEVIMSKIYLIHEQKVMLDMDIAELYGVETKALKQAVRRNIERFPEDFMFKLDKVEFTNLRSQIATSSWGGTRYLPMAFTEQGIAMLSSVLRSRQAISVNIRIVRVFTKLRHLLQTHKEILQKLDDLQRNDIEQDQKIQLIFEYIRQLLGQDNPQ